MSQAPTITPITRNQQQQIVDRVADLLVQCSQQFNHTFRPVEIRFDLRGRASGMYIVKPWQKYVRFNPYIFAKYFDDNLETTVPHEVAHYVSDILFGLQNIRPHGKEWRAIMQKLGVEPRVTGDYDLSGIPVKRQKRFDYVCGCTTHQLTTVRHNKVSKRKAQYLCRKCDGELTLAIAEK